jgi:hypothetical protein
VYTLADMYYLGVQRCDPHARARGHGATQRSRSTLQCTCIDSLEIRGIRVHAHNMPAVLVQRESTWMSGNPFLHPSGFYAPASLAKGIAALAPSLRTGPVAVWIDRKAALPDLKEALAAATRASHNPPLIVVVLYNLPNRDCAAKASAGEICCHRAVDGGCANVADGGCEGGLLEYQDSFLVPFSALLAQFSTVPVAVILEPDSLPNLVTNNAGMCATNATNAAYRIGLARAVQTINAVAPRASLYLDAGLLSGPALWIWFQATVQEPLHRRPDPRSTRRRVRFPATSCTLVTSRLYIPSSPPHT